MITNTDYGTWVNHGDQYNVSVEATLTDYLNGGDSEWCERVEASGAFDVFGYVGIGLLAGAAVAAVAVIVFVVRIVRR